MSNNVAIVTGAGGGIGREIVDLFLTSGMEVVAVDVSEAALAAIPTHVDAQRVHPFVGDLTDPAFTQELVDFAVTSFGGIDVIVPSAGIYTDAPFASMSDDTWRQTMDINVDSVFRLLRASVPHLRAGSSIVTLTSIASDRGSPHHAHYAASKGAILSLSRTLAIELAPQTRVNAVAPGVIATPMTERLVDSKGETVLENTPLKRFGSAREVAEVVAFLASQRASFITGECIRVNGGLHVS